MSIRKNTVRAELDAVGIKYEGAARLYKSKRVRKVRLTGCIIAIAGGLCAFTWGAFLSPSSPPFPTPLTAQAERTTPPALLEAVNNDLWTIGLVVCEVHHRIYYNSMWGNPSPGADYVEAVVVQAERYISQTDADLNHGDLAAAVRPMQEASVVGSRASKLARQYDMPGC
jgi:hypothetical protein